MPTKNPRRRAFRRHFTSEPPPPDAETKAKLGIDARVREILQPERDEITGMAIESLHDAARRRLDDTDPAVREAATALLGEGDPWTCMRRAVEAHDARDARVAANTTPEERQAGYAALANTPAVCRVCGCTDDDCSQCVEKTGEPCSWIERDLCSACLDEAYDPQEHRQP